MERFGWHGGVHRRGVDRGGSRAEVFGWGARTAPRPANRGRTDTGSASDSRPSDSRTSASLGVGSPAASGATGSSAESRGAVDEDPAVRRQRVEAVLLLSRTPLPARKLSQLAGLADATEARTLVRQLNQRYAEFGRAYRAEEIAGGYQLLTRPQLAPWLRRLGHVPKAVQLTPPAMETMAIVAYRQPVLRADIEAIRGVACGEILRQLMERDLVRISGRSEELGRPYLYSTTKRFLQLFGLHAADGLPAVEISELTDWSDTPESSDPIHEQHPVPGVPEEESDVSTAVAEVVLDCTATEEEQAPRAADSWSDPSQLLVAAIDDDPEDDVEDDVEDDLEEDELDDDKDLDDFDEDDEWEDDDEVEDEVEGEDEEDDEAELDDDDDADAEWEEVDDEWVEEDSDDDEWDDEDADDEDEDDEEEEWD